MRVSLFVLLVPTVFLWSCARQDSTSAANAPRATVLLRDGSRLVGNVVSSSPTQLTMAFDDNTRRTMDMSAVKAVEYDDAAPAAGVNPAPAAASHQQPRYNVVHENHYHPEGSVIQTKTHELAAGTEIPVRTEETIDSNKAVEGQIFPAEVTKDVMDAEGRVVIPRGSNAQIVIRSATQGGHFMGKSDLILDLRTVSVDGRLYQLDTADLTERGRDGLGKNKRTAEYVGGGAAIGAIIGAIAGHGRGAAIGAASGAAAGVAGEVLTKGHAIRVPVESVLTFRLDKPLRLSSLR